MTETQSKHHAVRTLKFKKGEQVIKQGDYGFSIYKILQGKIEVYREIEGMEVPLATLGPGEVIGEMIFLNRAIEVRYASAKAKEDAELEVWHPGALSMEYEKVSPVLKYVTDQAITRLIRMNKIVEQIGVKKIMQKEKRKKKKDPWSSRRAYYRKEVRLPCGYLPVSTRKGFKSALKGTVRDLSMTGLGLEMNPKNTSIVPHDVGGRFRVKMDLPNGKTLEVTAKIVFAYEARGKMRLGMSFTELDDYGSGARKTLGFFLLPA